MQYDLLQEPIHAEVCISFRNTYQEPFKHVEMRRQHISFKIRNQLPVILPNTIYHSIRDMVVKLQMGEYQYSKEINRQK